MSRFTQPNSASSPLRIFTLTLFCSGLAANATGQLLDVSGQAGQPATVNPLPGNIASPVNAFDSNNRYVTYFSAQTPKRVVISKYDGSSWGAAVRVDQVNDEPSNVSHDAPSVFVDGQGYVYVSYFASYVYAKEGAGADAPYFRRTMNPGDISSWLPEARLRLFNYSELHGHQLADGALLIAGTNTEGRIDIIEAGGESVKYRWAAARQVITQDPSPAGSNPGCDATSYLNRFCKGVFQPGPASESPQKLYVVWGWGGGYYDGERPAGLCEDVRHYAYDDHELFFAYSDDEGVTWRNKDATAAVASYLCPTRNDCNNKIDKGILHNDSRFMISTTRQGEHRRIWVDTDGTVNIAFTKSIWCDKGVCNDPNNKTVTNPGALMLVQFKLGGAVTERMVHKNRHFNVGSVARDDAGKLYIWALDQDANSRVYEYVSENNGETWSRTVLVDKSSKRLNGVNLMSGEPSVHLAFACPSGNGTCEIYYYHRAMGTATGAGTADLRLNKKFGALPQKMSVYDLRGRVVARTTDRGAFGRHELLGSATPGGVYFIAHQKSVFERRIKAR